MTYQKPELTSLAPAFTVIRQTCSAKGSGNPDSRGCANSILNTAAAYDADE